MYTHMLSSTRSISWPLAAAGSKNHMRILSSVDFMMRIL